MSQLLFSAVIDYNGGSGVDLTSLNPISTPNVVVVENTDLHDSAVFLQLEPSPGGSGDSDLPYSAGTAENCWRLLPGQRSPQIAIPASYTLWAYVLNSGDLATVQVQQANP